MPNNFSSDDFDMDINPNDSIISKNRNTTSSSRKTYLQQYKDNRAELERRKTTGGISKALSSIGSPDYNLKDHYDRLDKTSRLMTNSMNEFNEISSKNIKEMGTMVGSIKSITRDTTRMIANMARAGGRVISDSSYAQQFSQGAGDFGKAAKDMSVLRFLGNMNPVTAMLMAGVGTQGFKMARAGFRGIKNLSSHMPRRRNRSSAMYYNDPDYDLQGHYDSLDNNGRMIPKYHSGGYIYAHNGRKISNKNSRRGNPKLRKDEQITILKEGELVLPSHKPGFMRELAETIAEGISIHDKKSDRHLNDWYESRTEKEKYEFWKPLKGLLPEAFQDAQKGIFGTIASPTGIKQVFSNIVPVFGSQYKNELPKPSRVGMMGAIYKTLSLIYVATRQGSEELNDLLVQQTKIQMMGLGVEGTIKTPKYRSLAEMLGKGARGLLMSALGAGGQGDDFRKGSGGRSGGGGSGGPKGGSPMDYIYGGVNVARQKSGGIFSMLGAEVSQAWGKSKSGENLDKQRFGGGFGDQLISFFNIGTDKIGKVINDKFSSFAKSLDESIPEPKTLSDKLKATYQYVVPDMIKDALFGDTDDTGSRTGKTGIISVVNMLVKSISFSLKELVKGVGNILAGFNNYGKSVAEDFKEIWGDPNRGVFGPVLDSLMSVIGNVTNIFGGFSKALGNAFNIFLSSTGLTYLSSVKMGQSVYGSAKKASKKYGKGKIGRAAGVGVDAAYSMGTAGNDAFGIAFNKVIGSTGVNEIGGINPNEFQFRQDLSPSTSIKEDYIRGKGNKTGISGIASGVGSAIGNFTKDVSRPFLDPYYSAYRLGGYTATGKNIGAGINNDIVGTAQNIGGGLSSYAEGLGNLSNIWGSAPKHHKGGKVRNRRGRRNKKLQSNEVGIIAQEGEMILPTQEGGIFEKMQESLNEISESTSVLNDEKSLSSKVDSILTGEARKSDVEKSPIGTIKESLDNINDTMEDSEKSRKHDAKEASEEGSKGLWGRRRLTKEGEEGEKGGFFGKLGGILSKLGSLSVSAAGAAGFAIAGLWIYNKLPDEVKQFYKRNWKGAMAGSIIGAGLGLGLGGLPGIPIGLALGATFGAGGQQLWTDLPPEVKEWLSDAYSKYSGYAAVGGVAGGLIGLITLKSLKGAMIGSSIGAAILPAARKLEVDTGADKYIDPVLSALLGTYTEHSTSALVGSAAGMLLATTILNGGVKGAKIGAAVGGALAPILVEGAEYLGIDDTIAWLTESVIGFVADNSAGALSGSMIGGLLGLWKAPKGQKMRGFKIGSAVGAAVGPIIQQGAEITGLDKALGWIVGGASKLLAEHTTAALVGTMAGGLLGMYYAPPGMKMKGFGLGATVGGTIFPLLEDVADDYGVDKIFNAGIQFYKDNPYGAMGGAVIGAITGGIYGGFTPMMVGAGATLGSFVGGGIEWAGKKVADIFAPILGPVAEFIGDNSTGSVVGAVLGGVLAGVFSAGTAIPLGAMLGGLVGAGMEKGVKAVYGPVKEAWDYAMQFFTGIGTWVEQTIVSPIKGFFNTIVNSLSEHVITPINNFFISISDFFTSGIRKMIGSLPKGDWILSAMGWAPTPDESASKNESSIKTLKMSSEEAFNSLSAEEKNKIESELTTLYPKLKAEAEAAIPLPSTSIYGDIVDIMTPGAASSDKAKTDRNLLVQQEVAKKMLEKRKELLGGRGGPEEPVQNDPLASWQPTSAIGKLIKAGLSKVMGVGKSAIDSASNIINPVDKNISSPSMQDLLSGYDKLPPDSITGITERAETGRYPGNPATITNDVGGTRSYGLFQFNSKGGMNSPVGKFIFNSPWASQFQGYAPATKEFENKWREIAASYPEQFSDYQRKQIIMTHYMPLASRMMKFGWDTTKEPAAIQAMLLSTGVQFGPNTKVLDSIVSDPNWINKTPEEKIAAIANKKSIAYPPTAKRYAQEMKNAIAMLTPADKKDNMSNVDVLKNSTIGGINQVKTFMFGENKAEGFWPVAAGRVTSNFGLRNDPLTGKPSGHKGIDLGTPPNSPVHAIASGTAKVLKDPGGYGNWLEIQHSNGTTSRYAHLNQSMVSTGDYVKSGQVIAKSGNTGRSTGPHLHFEVRQNGEPVNPMLMLGSIPPDTKPGSLDPNKTGVVNNLYAGTKDALSGAAESTAGVVNDIAGRAGGPYTSAAIQNIIETQSKYDMAKTNYNAASNSRYLQDLGDELGGVREGMNEAAGAIVNAGRTIVMTTVSNNKSNNNSDSSGHDKEIKELVDLLMRGYDMGLA